MNPADTVAKFRETAVVYAEAGECGNYRRSNRAFMRLLRLRGALWKVDPESCRLLLPLLDDDNPGVRIWAAFNALDFAREDAIRIQLARMPLPEGYYALEPLTPTVSLAAVLDAGIPVVNPPEDSSEECDNPCREYKPLEQYGIKLEQLKPLYRKAVAGTFQPVRSYEDKVVSHHAYVWLIELGCSVVQSDERVQREFMSLLTLDEPLNVRLAVATQALYIEPDTALPVLRRIAHSASPEYAMKAIIMLQDWDNHICDIGL